MATTNDIKDDPLLQRAGSGAPSQTLAEATGKVVDAINEQRREEFMRAMSPSNSEVRAFLEKIEKDKHHETFEKGNKPGKHRMRKIASIPQIVDNFFIKLYGPEYYKEEDFFTRKHPEWRVVKDPNWKRALQK